MRKYFLILLFFSLAKISRSQDDDSIEARIVLIGDAGKLDFGRQPVVDAERNLIPLDKKTTILYLGDNNYEGVSKDFLPQYQTSKAIIDSEINIAKGTKSNVIFIPGNHDWTAGGGDHLANLKREERYISAVGGDNVHYFPAGGCPGPVEYDISKDVILVLYDSEWFLEKGDKPGIESDCGSRTETAFYNELDNILGDNRDKLVLLAGHHTLKSYGIHGGYFTLKQYIFPFTDLNPNLWIPLPVIGTIYPIARGVFGSPEDLHYPAYSNMIKNIEKIVKPFPNVVYLGGHEHNLQLIKDSSYYYIVSGSGSKKTRVSQNKHVLYEAASLGFATLTISKKKNLHVDFYTVTSDSVKHTFQKKLLNFSYLEKPHDSTTIPEAQPEFHFKDSVKVAIDTQYNNVSSFHKFISGSNYRKEWATPVHLKVFNISKTLGGFKIRKIGGGHQTKSLKLTDKNGRKWDLRTVDKDPAGALPEAFKGTIAQKIVQDMISAQSPYGPLVVPALAKAVGVVHNNPVYYFVPDDPALGRYREVFANKVCLLEPENPLSDDMKTKSDFEVLDKMIDDSKEHVDQQAVLRDRLFDMVIGDWDRHFGQWQFATLDTGEGKLYLPMPEDRDQAFFNSDGLLAWAVSLSAMPYLQGFKKKYRNINWFNWEERDFDRIFMNNLDAPTWQRTISNFQKNLTDSVIEHTLKEKLPPAIYPISSKEIAAKLKSRRDLLTTRGMKYYRFLSKEVNVVSSNKEEFFRVSTAPKNGLEVKVFKRKDLNDSSTLMYDRVFQPNVTKYVNLYGLNGNDIFYIDSNVNSKIKLRIIGGEGIDTFNIHGHIKNKIYDYAPEANFLHPNGGTKNEMSSSPDVNDYKPMSYQYNSYRIPMLNLGYNDVEYLLIGLGYSLKTYEFRKEPYATYQKLSSLFSLSQKAYQVKYRGEFNEIYHNNDLVFNGEFYNPVLNNFFGLGNESMFDKNIPHQFYYVRYKYVNLEALLRKKYFNNLLQFYIGPTYFHYWSEHGDNVDKILEHPRIVGLDSSSIYNTKSYLGGKFSIVLNNLNSELLPTRGVVWNTDLTSMAGINKNSHPITKLTSDMEVYASLRDPAKLVAVIKLGAGHIFNPNYEYFQALNLGANNYLRGFRKNRFTGQSMLYETTELRVKLFESKSYVVPGAVGVIAFNEVGRVWIKDEVSHKWHDDYGGGIYYSPYNFALISAVIAHSPEDNLFNFSIGTKFNINF